MDIFCNCKNWCYAYHSIDVNILCTFKQRQAAGCLLCLPDLHGKTLT